MVGSKKNIGILTMPVKENYGGIIQAAALYHFLEKEGYEPYLIMKKYDESVLKRYLRYILTHNPLAFVFDYKDLTKREKQVVFLEKFIEDFFKNRTNVAYNVDEYVRSVENLDTIIVGSDQVWRYQYIGKDYSYYFLDFLPKHIIKIAYAASFGIDSWEGNENSVKKIREYLQDFKAISVRENTGVNLCKERFDYSNAIHVLDPTFLVDVSFYNSLIDKKGLDKKIELFSYVLDKSAYIQDVINLIEKEKGYSRTEIELTNYSKGVKPSIEEWLYHFREANFVVTDSFHGVVFCILFQKQFICVANSERGLTRFESLLGLFDLSDRIINKDSMCNLEVILNSNIDYSPIMLIIDKLRKVSKHFILDNV